MASIPLEPCLEQAMDTGILKKELGTSKTLFSEQNPKLFFKSEFFEVTIKNYIT